MWLSSSSVGRKFVMAVTGACLVLFITFHCLMNAICICWPAAYNSICEFLGANWYALIASAGLAALIIIHIIYACWLTIQNRRARGAQRYAVSKRPATVEWSSKNMLVLGFVVLAFLVVHLINFWAKMQLVEVLNVEGQVPPTAGTLFIQEAFSNVYVPIVYIAGFVALWFHMNHGFWSMFESVGWTNNAWIARLKKIGCWWVTIVIGLFIAQAIVFTVKAHEDYYKTNPELRDQYIAMAAERLVPLFGPQVSQMSYDQMAQQIPMAAAQFNMQFGMMKQQAEQQPGSISQQDLNDAQERIDAINYVNNFIQYLEGTPAQPEEPQVMPGMPQPAQQPAAQQPAAEEVEVEAVEAVPAGAANNNNQ